MGVDDAKDGMPSGLGNRVLLAKIDSLRELNVGTMVPLPQLVVVGDQSSGKSSVLESLTGFSFPRAPGLCTRYATQITVRRGPQESVKISIIPRPHAEPALKEKLKKFRRRVPVIEGANFAQVFEEANTAMGIRKAGGPDVDTGLTTFSEDTLKIDITRPTGDHLTVIDVPGIFRASTPGLTTDNDIVLVRNMVKRYMKDSRTIILAVVPCTVDIATQEILKLAKEADPEGKRTMGVLTKPDLATERATQQAVLDLVNGNRNDLSLGYTVVKNRGADDRKSSLQQRHEAERLFFAGSPWNKIQSSGRVGIEALTKHLSRLLLDIAKHEFPNVKSDISKRLEVCRKRLEGMGASRSEPNAQRLFLGRLSTRFQSITEYALNAYYTGDKVFTEKPEMKLITRIIEANDAFSRLVYRHGHTRNFEASDDDGNEFPEEGGDKLHHGLTADDYPELTDILADDDWECPEVQTDDIMEYIQDVFHSSKGPELGTFSGSILTTTFKEQTKKWEPLVMQHVSQAILIVHHFVTELIRETCPDDQVREGLWDSLLLDELCATYKQAMEKAKFLLDIEREGNPITYNDFFNKKLQRARTARLGESLKKVATVPKADGELEPTPMLSIQQLLAFSADKANGRQVCEDIHDILKSYYEVSRKRFVDTICQQVIDHDLLNGKGSPLRLFRPELVLGMDEVRLEMIAGEDSITRGQREKLGIEMQSLEAALKVLRG